MHVGYEDPQFFMQTRLSHYHLSLGSFTTVKQDLLVSTLQKNGWQAPLGSWDSCACA